MRGLLLRLAAAAARLLPLPLRRALYRLGPLTRALRALLTRAAPEGPQEVTVAAGALAGARLLLDLKDEKDLWLGTYEPELQASLEMLVRPGMVAYDLGSHVGYVALMLARRVGPEGRVFAFEPLPANLARLRANLALNPEGQWVTVVPAAVADRDGRRPFLVHASESMGRVAEAPGRQTTYQGTLEVDVVALDTFVYRDGHPPPDLIKVDVEGAEGLALAGMERLLAEARPVLLLEVHGKQAARQVWDHLSRAGYRLHRMARGLPPVASQADLPGKAYLVARPGGAG